MEILESLLIASAGSERRVDLCAGDLTAIPPEDKVDVLVVSAFPDDYLPTESSLIGALAQRGISVAKLAQRKQVDLREMCSVWLSEAVEGNSGFDRILCFEPAYRGMPPEVVGDIFRGLIPFAEGNSAVRSVAMPLVATGDMGTPVSEMLDPLLAAAIFWLRSGLHLDRLMITVNNDDHLDAARAAFAKAQDLAANDEVSTSKPRTYDVFLSYAHENTADMELVERFLLDARPEMRIFVDRQELSIGAPWQQEIHRAIDACSAVVSLITPSYLRSKICQEEINMAIYRDRDASQRVLFPLYTRRATLPSYLGVRQYADCTEASPQKLQSACADLAWRV